MSTDTIRFVNENEPQHERAICQIDFLSMAALSAIRFDSTRLGSGLMLIILRVLLVLFTSTFFAIDVRNKHLPPFESIDDLNPLVVCTNNAPIITNVVKAFESS